MKKKISLTLIFLISTFLFFVGQAYAKTEILINKATNQLYYNRDNTVFQTFPVATGRTPSLTPEGKFTIVIKIVNPSYSRLKIPGGSPNNPLGYRWLGLSVGGGGVYGIHGTNRPSSIGTYASAGCIRMLNQDVAWLFENTPVGTPVQIINNPGAKPNWLAQKPETIKKPETTAPPSKPETQPENPTKPEDNTALQLAGLKAGQALIANSLCGKGNLLLDISANILINKLSIKP